MSAQINLYHPRFLKQHDPLTLKNVAIAVVALYAVLALAGGWIGTNAAQRRDAASLVEAQLKQVTDQVAAETAAAENRKPDPRLLAELQSSRICWSAVAKLPFCWKAAASAAPGLHRVPARLCPPGTGRIVADGLHHRFRGQ